MRIAAVTEEHLSGVRALFEQASCPCFCRYWHFTGTKNDWLARCAEAPGDSFAELVAAVRADREDGRALVAIDDEGRVVGWMKLARRSALPKLRGLPVYRALELGDDATTFSIGCFLVHPAHRRRGVSRALLAAAPDFAASWGGLAVEGYPRRSTEPLHDEEAWQGAEEIFRAAGFALVSDTPPYPVYRRVLSPPFSARQ